MVGRFKCPTRARGKYHISSPGKRRERVRKREKTCDSKRGEEKRKKRGRAKDGKTNGFAVRESSMSLGKGLAVSHTAT
jgi:hypothetical protein